MKRQSNFRGEGLTYTRNLTNNLFSGNSFEIAPGTFDTIHNIDDYTYYQTKPREKCTVFFQRRKITEKANKQIEDYHFPVTAVSFRSLIPSALNQNRETNQTVEEIEFSENKINFKPQPSTYSTIDRPKIGHSYGLLSCNMKLS